MPSNRLFASIVLIAFTSCGTGNRWRFEKFTDIDLPSSISIVKDEYQDMGPDFARILEVKLNNSSLAEMKTSIEKSKFFNPSFYSDNGVQESQLQKVGDIQGVWYRNKMGFSFLGRYDNKTCNIYVAIDTVAGTGKFEYLSD